MRVAAVLLGTMPCSGSDLCHAVSCCVILCHAVSCCATAHSNLPQTMPCPPPAGVWPSPLRLPQAAASSSRPPAPAAATAGWLTPVEDPTPLEQTCVWVDPFYKTMQEFVWSLCGVCVSYSYQKALRGSLFTRNAGQGLQGFEAYKPGMCAHFKLQATMVMCDMCGQ
jgi:hypothetical protein